MNTQKFLIAIGVAVVLVLGVTFPKGNTVVERITTQFGAAAGPDMSGPYLSVGGVASWSERQVMKQATSTLCAFKSPSSTSTLDHFSATFSTTASYATVYAVGNDPTAFSTTTSIIAATQMSFAANSANSTVASTTKPIIPPSTYVNLKLSTTTAGASATFAPVGACEAVFIAL